MEIFQPFGVGQYQSSIGRVIGGLAVAETAAHGIAARRLRKELSTRSPPPMSRRRAGRSSEAAREPDTIVQNEFMRAARS
jgi:hypothetical protein